MCAVSGFAVRFNAQLCERKLLKGFLNELKVKRDITVSGRFMWSAAFTLDEEPMSAQQLQHIMCYTQHADKRSQDHLHKNVTFDFTNEDHR